VVAKSDAFDDKAYAQAAPLVLKWVALNHEALNRFWWTGNDLMHDEVQAFIADLKTV
jgi:hypothetical protein